MELKQFDGQSKDELAMVDVAHAILEQTGQVTNYNDLLVQVAEYLNIDDNELEAEMIQFYTDLNIDGRFISLGSNRWGLRSWYPIDSIDEEITHDNDEEDEKPRRRNRKGFDDEIEVFEDDEEDVEEDVVEFGDRVDVDEHGVMVDDEDEENLGEYKADLEDLGDDDDDDENIAGLSVVDDEDVLGDDDEEE
ncbi:DNA-directed RNA polymerase subunit delta [Marinilactibacillus sp. Marseille-P9653]|uniref:DNA-directed RNA polymerase subunit delta n=1 Tax=Marinilactibacillus sp. Marseille-P9653 TaxID=2866583 RepID=UPI001CE41507|nr:DNA-directed RNA polymerase subunit delta [Marinilactibacillus sp. Marseille-P9653]